MLLTTDLHLLALHRIWSVHCCHADSNCRTATIIWDQSKPTWPLILSMEGTKIAMSFHTNFFGKRNRFSEAVTALSLIIFYTLIFTSFNYNICTVRAWRIHIYLQMIAPNPALLEQNEGCSLELHNFLGLLHQLIIYSEVFRIGRWDQRMNSPKLVERV